jgi:DNA-directed RNA polymerase specialized sigma54-like protein
MLDYDYIPYPNPDVIYQDEDGGWAVLVNMDTGNSIAVNNTGKFIWKAADGRKSLGQIISHIKESFSGIPDDIEKDVAELVDNLKANGFLGYKVKC